MPTALSMWVPELPTCAVPTMHQTGPAYMCVNDKPTVMYMLKCVRSASERNW